MPWQLTVRNIKTHRVNQNMNAKFNQLVETVVHLDQWGQGKVGAFVGLRLATAEKRAAPGPSPPTHKAAAQS